MRFTPCSPACPERSRRVTSVVKVLVLDFQHFSAGGHLSNLISIPRV